MGLFKIRPKHTQWTGDESEAHIMARLVERGYTVLVPYGKNSRYDIVIEGEEPGVFYRIQCKTGWVEENEGVITFATASSYNHTRKGGWRGYQGEVDYFAVYCKDTRGVYLVPVEDVGKTEARLRLRPTKNRQEGNVRWAKDYEL